MSDGPGRIFDALDAAARRSPDVCAVRSRDVALTYGELDRYSRSCAAWLGEWGVRRGDRVVVYAWNSVEISIWLYGAARAGAVLVPLSPELRPFQLRQILDDAEPAIVVADQSLHPMARVAGASRIIDIRQAWRTCAAAVVTEVEPADLALLIYTSGTTSLPKGVMSTHAHIMFAVRAIMNRLGYRAGDCVFLFLPISFDYGLYQQFLTCGAVSTLYLADQRVPAGLLRELAASGATVVPLVPVMADMLVRLSKRGPVSTRVRLFTNTGALLPVSVMEDLRSCFPEAFIVRMYGITECKRVSIGEPDEDRRDPQSLGLPLDGTEVVILDDDGVPAAPGVTGEIVVRGPHVMAGYWRAPELTEQRFRCDPRTGLRQLHTGDFGCLDENGRLRFEGRRDDILKRRGIRISLHEVESAALDVDGVDLAAALASPATGRLILCVTGVISTDRLAAELKERLDHARIPDRIEIFDTLPVGHNGKLDRIGLLAKVEA